ncbi:MAG TPA: FtsQ-type POTRA domain-containing protein [Anaerolineales bacterium]
MSTRRERTRAEAVRLRRREQTQKRVKASSVMATRPLPPITSRGDLAYPGSPRSSSASTRRSYQTSLSMPGIEIRMPAVHLTTAGARSRLLSLFLSLLLGACIYLAATLPEFHAAPARVTGNGRISAQEINTSLNTTGESIFALTGASLENRLRQEFPDLESVHVAISLPNLVSVSIVERQPVVLWQQGNGYTWIDASGIAFRPRGTAGNLVPVIALAPPPALAGATADPLAPLPYITADLVKAIQTLAPDVPQGETLQYDPNYGLGWTDSRGWKVFFGDAAKDMPMKLQVYTSLVNDLAQKGIHPTFISVQYANAPYYRISQ